MGNVNLNFLPHPKKKNCNVLAVQLATLGKSNLHSENPGLDSAIILVPRDQFPKFSL